MNSMITFVTRIVRGILTGGMFFLVYGGVASSIYVALFYRDNPWAGIAIIGLSVHACIGGAVGGPMYELVTWTLARERNAAVVGSRRAILGAGVFAVCFATFFERMRDDLSETKFGSWLVVTLLAGAGGAVFPWFVRLVETTIEE
jgi:hypothetical protein